MWLFIVWSFLFFLSSGGEHKAGRAGPLRAPTATHRITFQAEFTAARSISDAPWLRGLLTDVLTG